ncbi:MAG: hypothetical protein LC803_02600 [Acidobacteria bacterium]|nr:hypothetical protein [Acidobacteriota bacterium]
MKIPLRIGVSILCLGGFQVSAPAQTGAPRENVSQPAARKAAKSRRARGKEKAAAAVRRQQVLWQLENVEGKARKLDDSILKVKVLAKLADTLWPHQESHARLLFAEAFQAIAPIKLDANKDQRVKMAAASGATHPLAALRAEVLQLAAARDFKLADRLRQTVKEQPGGAAAGETPAADSSEREHLAWDIAIAAAKTQPEQTAQFVRAQLRRGIHEELGEALLSIRLENRQLADQLFGEALAIARANLTAPESLETLAIYVLPTADPSHDRTPAFAPAPVPGLSHFLAYASERLAALSAAGQAVSSEGAESQHEYRTLQALLPLFEQVIPDKAPLVRDRMAALSAAMSPRQANAVSPREPEDVTELLRRAEATVGSQRRDARLMQVSMIAARQGDLEQALSIAERIGDGEERTIQVSLLAYQALLKALQKGEIEEAYRWTRKIEFLPQRVAAAVRLANALRAKREADRARVVLEEGWESVAKAPNSPLKAKALLTLTAAMTPHDPERGFTFLFSAVKTISGTDFSPPDTTAPSRVAQVTLDTLDFGSVFSPLSRIDFDRAMHAAQSLTPVEASLLAQVIVCRQALT